MGFALNAADAQKTHAGDGRNNGKQKPGKKAGTISGTGPNGIQIEANVSR